MTSDSNDIKSWADWAENAILKSEPGMLDMKNIRSSGSSLKPTNTPFNQALLNEVVPGTEPLYSQEYDRKLKQDAEKMAEVWKLNDQRNKQLKDQ